MLTLSGLQISQYVVFYLVISRKTHMMSSHIGSEYSIPGFPMWWRETRHWHRQMTPSPPSSGVECDPGDDIKGLDCKYQIDDGHNFDWVKKTLTVNVVLLTAYACALCYLWPMDCTSRTSCRFFLVTLEWSVSAFWMWSLSTWGRGGGVTVRNQIQLSYTAVSDVVESGV